MVTLALVAFALVSGCGSGGEGAPSLSPTPQVAPSVAATSLPDPVPSSPVEARIVSFFLKAGVTSRQRSQLGEQIARMSEVQAFAFVSQKLALQRMRKRLANNHSTIVLPDTLMFPASFEIAVKARGDGVSVARRFENNPLVDNDPGTHDGVTFGGFPTKP